MRDKKIKCERAVTLLQLVFISLCTLNSIFIYITSNLISIIYTSMSGTLWPKQWVASGTSSGLFVYNPVVRCGPDYF